MKSLKTKVQQLSNSEMLNHSSKSYNKSVWEEKVNRFIELGVKFYEAKPDDCYSYSRFFVEHRINEGLYFLSSWSGFSSSLTSRGFVKAFIINDEIFTMGFGPERDSVVVNTKEGRKWLAENVCANGIMITNSL